MPEYLRKSNIYVYHLLLSVAFDPNLPDLIY